MIDQEQSRLHQHGSDDPQPLAARGVAVERGDEREDGREEEQHVADLRRVARTVSE